MGSLGFLRGHRTDQKKGSFRLQSRRIPDHRHDDVGKRVRERVNDAQWERSLPLDIEGPKS